MRTACLTVAKELANAALVVLWVVNGVICRVVDRCALKRRVEVPKCVAVTATAERHITTAKFSLPLQAEEIDRKVV